jgi:hypothetical protein
VADLLEAEGRSLRDAARAEGRVLRKHFARFSLGAAVLIVAALLAFIGLILLLAGLFLWLRVAMSPAGAAALTGLVTLAITGVLLWVFRTLTK